MLGFASALIEAFILGLLTPLTAVCVLPLYPGFLAYLANRANKKDDKRTLAMFGVVITLGAILFMSVIGLLFTTVLGASLTNVIGVVSPIAFGVLFLIGLMLLFGVNPGKYAPKLNAPVSKNPLAEAFLYGFFFGAIVIPCNPLFIAALFARAATAIGFVSNVLRFVFFGLGIGAPLLLFSLLSFKASGRVIGFLAGNARKINVFSGLFMVSVSAYYLIYVFHVFG